MSEGILERLATGPVLGDGGYLLELEKRGYVRAGPFTPEVSLTHPDALAELHREFLRAGAEVLQALTFYASEEKLATVGLAGMVDELNRSAVRIARQVAREGREAGAADALVAGNLALTWAYDPSDPASADRVRALFDQQLEVQVAEGVDFIIGETFTWLGEALLAAERARATGLPVMITMAFENDPHAYEGDDAAACVRKLADAGVDIVGLNCLRGPAQTLPLLAEMRAAVPGHHLAAQPVAYRTTDAVPDFTALDAFPVGLDPFQLTRAEMAEFALEAQALGADYIGSCCGSVAVHVREMARALGKLPPEERTWRVDYAKPMSAYEYYGHADRV
ncbi:MAG: homocysteine S-methyltransferase family protein [Candidatus Limnocylindrales bacterium]